MRIVGGQWRGRALLTPDDTKRPDSIRPTSDRAREAIFNILYSGWGLPHAHSAVADICCGTGALALEALSRGAARATLVDKNPAAIKLAQQNIEKMRATATVIYGDAAHLPPAPGPHDLVFIDAPYNQGLTEPALPGLAANGWLADGAVVVVECATGELLAVPRDYRQRDERRYGAAKVVFLEWMGADKQEKWAKT